ncbi:MAG: DUF1385 domain-containing protein [Lachnospiraceae bacterium]|nr:DUF1385 domain-containing protein [Lachnospiraceae bacterium]
MEEVRKGQYSGIGGLAVLEGVMMRNKDKYAVAVRRPDGTVSLRVAHYRALLEGSILLRIPFVRGIFVFIDSMRLSLRSMNEATGESEEEVAARKEGRQEKWSDKLMMAGTFLLSFALAIALFVVAPYFAANLIASYVRSAALLSVFEGIIRILIFVGYILLISRLTDIRRLFGYHGAEHKCINCLETGHTLTLENVREASRLHKRCGSSFVLFVMMVSIVLFFFIRVESIPLRLLLRIVLLPVVSGISYELIRLAGRNDNLFVRILSAPGFAMQRLTTREPDDEMIEVGIRSVEAVFDWKSYLQDTFGYEA